MHYDVFNGDADGICALLQLRFAEPKESKLITGVKRDIQLLKQVAVSDDTSSVTVLDISLEKNLEALHQLLTKDIDVFYCDHHRTGVIPSSNHLATQIDTAPEICTSLLINSYLNDNEWLWACVGAFGDNLLKQGNELAKSNGLSDEDIHFLKELGTLINYNGYGASLEDLHFHPAELYRNLYNYPNPIRLKEDPNSVFYQLQSGFKQDWDNVENTDKYLEEDGFEVYIFPNQPWARRISGTFGNWLANQKPDKAFAVLTDNGESYTVSVRSPLNNREGADEVCAQFETGGGRKAAAGINSLPKPDLEDFVRATRHRFGS
ncbi:hypothetical protein JCM19241_4989 [Vibrio ishigakensis]|uniref:Acetyltransferase n=1 Tax=Vibrio ishigakensis TaxID=1481914 RepID=A0A0B8QF65_9VIBR|nr:hypothetical protein JCM19241_4989 [Vibrio ishigakensis]